MKNLYLILLLLLVGSSSFGQEKINEYKSSEILEGIGLKLEKGNLEGALSLIDQISPNDSIYESLQITKSYCLLNTGQFKKAEAFLEKNLKKKEYFLDRDSYYLNLLITLANLEKHKEQEERAKAAIEEFPYNASFYYYLADAQHEQGKHNEAFESVTRAISLHPTKPSYQFLAGDLYMEQGKMAEGLMHYNMGLLFTENRNYLGTVEQLMSKRAAAEDAKFVKQMEDDRLEDVNLMMGNLVALSKKYKIEGKFDFALCKQNYLIQEAIPSISSDQNKWIDKYIKFHQWVKETDQFVPFSLCLLQSSNNDKIVAQVKKEQRSLKLFYQEALKKIEELFKENSFMIDGEVKNFDCYFESGNLRGFGDRLSEEGLHGNWYLINNGIIEEKGAFDDKGERTGNWESFHENKQIDSKGSYANGEYDKNFKLFDTDGKNSLELNYDNGVLQGELLVYDNGILKETKTFDKGELDGEYISYFSNTDKLVSYKGVYKAGKAEGTHYYYYPNGSLQTSKEFKDNTQTGIEKFYHPTGDLDYSITVENDKYEGTVSNLNTKGDTIQISYYKNGERTGEWIEFYESGVVKTTYNYENNILNGLYKDFHHNGQLITEYEYKDGFVYSASFWDKKGNLLFSGSRKGKKLAYEGYNAEGKKTVSGTYNVKGGQEGEWIYYNPKNGSIVEKANFSDGKREGISYYFNEFGKKTGYDTYSDGQLNGYSVRFFPDGQIKSDLYYKNDLPEGDQRIFHQNGKLKETIYYHKGQINGKNVMYAYEGWKAAVYEYDMGEIQRLEVFDNKENLIQEIDFSVITEKTTLKRLNNQGILAIEEERIQASDNGLTKTYHPNGNLRMKGNYINNKGEGLFTYYNTTGELSMERNFVNNLEHGISKAYHPNGQLKSSTTYVLNNLHGLNKYYSDKGVLESERYYQNNELHGPSIFYNSEGEKELIRNYEMGVLVSYSYLLPEGKMSETLDVKDENLELSIFDNNKMLRRKLTIVNGYFQGEYTQYFANGKLMEKSVYKNDNRDGSYEEYFDSGLLKEKSLYKDGLLHGESDKYFENGKLKSKTIYEFGVRIGEALIYNEEGKLIEKHIFENDNLQNIIKL